jgi:hypothetical protein
MPLNRITSKGGEVTNNSLFGLLDVASLG